MSENQELPLGVRAKICATFFRSISEVAMNENGDLSVILTDGTSVPLGNAKGPKGDKGDAGDAFTYSDFTAEQLAALKGGKGDTGETGAKGDKGDKGDAFTYSDFTAAQLASLKGEKGDTGETGAKGDKGDTGEQGDSRFPAGIVPIPKDGWAEVTAGDREGEFYLDISAPDALETSDITLFIYGVYEKDRFSAEVPESGTLRVYTETPPEADAFGTLTIANENSEGTVSVLFEYAESWVFTLDDSSTVTKRVVLI